MTYSIGELARDFGLSRSTLLYYDKLGLLTPSARSPANYRRYSEQDYQKLAKIKNYRDTGLSLKAIDELLSRPSDCNRVVLLENQLAQLNKDISALRKQQQTILELLGSEGINLPARSMSKQQWVQLLASIGMSDKDMMQWHREFEQRMPEAHQDFLESLNISVEEIAQIRALSGKDAR